VSIRKRAPKLRAATSHQAPANLNAENAFTN
jgi:hypothetical protein